MWAGLRLIACSAALFACSEAMAEDLGRIGPVWPVAERDLSQVLIERMREKERSGELARMHQRMRKRARDYVHQPGSLHLPRADRDRSFRLDPSIEVLYDIRGENGRLLHAAGTRVNPLEHVQLSKRLVFLDQSDAQQTAWLDRHLQRAGRTKIVLTGGSPELLARRLGLPVYFDQKGLLVEQLEIRAVPAIVSQDGKQLLIREERP